MYNPQALDRWLTTAPEYYGMDLVTREALTDTCPESGLPIALHVDELCCEDCEGHIGWSSEHGFVEFYADDSDKHFKCEDCHTDWKENWYTE